MCVCCHISLCKFHLFLQWETFFDSEGRIKDSEAFRKRIFYGGVDHELRKEVFTLLCVGNYELSTLFEFAFSYQYSQL